jgi:septum formation protein
MRLVLASGSPRRRELLSFLAIPFDIRPADLDETPHVGEQAEPYVGRLSVEKALAVAQPGELVLAADTTVALHGEILGKPTDRDDAIRMLTMLSGRRHQVHTGLALADGNTGQVLHAHVDTADVVMSATNLALIEWYVDTGEPLDKAGAYGVQGIGSVLVERVEGNVQTVIGLPMTIVASWLWPLRVT